MIWLRHVPFDRVPAYLALGWMFADLCLTTHHHAYGVLMGWACCCGREMVEPAGGRDG